MPAAHRPRCAGPPQRLAALLAACAERLERGHRRRQHAHRHQTGCEGRGPRARPLGRARSAAAPAPDSEHGLPDSEQSMWAAGAPVADRCPRRRTPTGSGRRGQGPRHAKRRADSGAISAWALGCPVPRGSSPAVRLDRGTARLGADPGYSWQGPPLRNEFARVGAAAEGRWLHLSAALLQVARWSRLVSWGVAANGILQGA